MLYERIIKYSVVIVLFGFCSTVLAQSSVWRVSKQDREIFLGGTIHILSESDYPLPCEFDRAYSQADKLIFETDMRAVQSPNFVSDNIHKFFYRAPNSLHQNLMEQTHEELVAYLREHDFNVDNMMRLKPGMLMSMLLMNKLQATDKPALGVDAFFARKAITDKKRIAFLETPQQQVDFIAQIGIGSEEQFVRYLLRDLANLDTQFPQMKEAWREGDLSLLGRVADMDLLKWDFPDLYNTLMVKRNNTWMLVLLELIQNEEVELVLVGTLHLPDEHGLLEQFRSQGYTVEQLTGCQ